MLELWATSRAASRVEIPGAVLKEELVKPGGPFHISSSWESIRGV